MPNWNYRNMIYLFSGRMQNYVNPIIQYVIPLLFPLFHWAQIQSYKLERLAHFPQEPQMVFDKPTILLG